MKIKLLLLFSFLLLSFNIFSIETSNVIENNLATLGGEPSAIVNGCVNVVTGAYINFSTDMVVPGPEPLLVQKSYTSTSGWKILGEESLCNIDLGGPSLTYVAHSKDGMTTSYDHSSQGTFLRHENYVHGLTNCGEGFLSGQTNPKNQKVDFIGTQAVLSDGSGRRRIFEKTSQMGEDGYELQAIQNPNNNFTTVNNTKTSLGLRPRTIANFNAAHQELNRVIFDYQDFKIDPRLIVYSNDQRQCHYNFGTSRDKKYQIFNAYRPNAPFQTFEYDTKNRIKSYILPEGRKLEIGYYNEGHNILPGMPQVNINIKYKDEPVNSRVLYLAAPVGTDSTPICTHRFLYNLDFYEDKKFVEYCADHSVFTRNHTAKALKSGSTVVFDANGKVTQYFYDGQLRLTGIHQYETGSLYRQQNFLWGPIKHTDVKGNLLFKTLSDAQGQIHSCIAYQYDSKGNVLNEQLSGILTGKNFSIVPKNPYGIPCAIGCDTFAKSYIYSQEGLNLLLQENDGRKQINYFYHPGTNLLITKLISDNGTIKYREFYHYDANGQPTVQIKDDGSTPDQENLLGVSERHIIHIQYRETTPIGLPKCVEEKYLDLSSKQEKLLKKTENIHDLQGNLIEQKHYDSDENLRYSLFWEYNTHNKVIKEINAAGYVTSFLYDDNDNLVFEQHPGNDYYTSHFYDFSNRLIRSENIFPHVIHTTHHSYNLLGQKTSTTDWYGQQTFFEYDDCGRIKKITYPAVLDQAGKLYHPTESMTYDIFDYPTSKIDKRGFVTNTRCNIRGQPYWIQYPDGSSEKNEYTLDGLLEKQTTLNGAVTQHYFDYLGRTCLTTMQAPSGEYSQTSCVYNFFHKLQEMDPAGHSTYYKYDYAGRLISVVKEDKRTDYQYDNCGRVSKILEYFGPDEYVTKVQEYDILDRVIEERNEDVEEHVLSRVTHVYNSRGERIQTLSYHESTPAITSTEYNSYSQISKIIDPEGYTTSFNYIHGHLNDYQQYVFAKETIDAMGNILYQENDTGSRLRFEIRKDAMGVIRQKREFFYDPSGNLIKQKEYVITPEQADKLVETLFSYNFANCLTDCVEAVGTSEQKHTQHVYNTNQEKIQTIKPDGNSLEYSYDGFGRLKNFKDSKHTFHYSYYYDQNSNVIKVEDVIQGKTTIREFDANNRQLSEKLANELKLSYVYDRVGRTTQLILPDQSSIHYSYGPIHLNSVQRGNYTHHYLTYNLSGQLEKAQMIGQLGEVDYQIDSCQRLRKITSSYLTEEIPENGFDKCGNLLHRKVQDINGTLDERFNYDTLYQLNSESGVVDHTFVHDSLHNLVQKDDSKHQINALNQLLNDEQQDHIYDPNGNLIQKGSLKLSYDALDRLICVDNGSETVTYQYDELNRRLCSIHGSGESQRKIYYFYQNLNEIGACDEQGQIKQLRVLGVGKGAEIGAAVLVELDGITYAPIHDIAGHLRALVNVQDEKIFESYRYSAFGEEQIFDSFGQVKESSLNPWRFSCKRKDDETGFINFGRRYYNPFTARWITADPLGHEAGPNLYAYVSNNPLNHFDLYGLEKSFRDDFGSYSNRRHERTYGEKLYGSESERINTERESNRLEKNADRAYHRIVGRVERAARKSLPDVRFGEYDRKFCSCFDKSDLFKFDGKSLKGYGVGFAGGINMDKDDYYKVGHMLKELGWDYEIDLQYNPSHNIFNDLAECMMGLCYIATDPVKVIHEAWNNFFKENPDGKYLQLCHSQGAINVRNALLSFDAKFREQIIVVAIAPGAYIYEQTCGEIYHYKASMHRDIVPYLDIAGASRNRHNTTTLKSHPDAAFFDHSFLSPTYRDTIQDHLDRFKLSNKI